MPVALCLQPLRVCSALRCAINSLSFKAVACVACSILKISTTVNKELNWGNNTLWGSKGKSALQRATRYRNSSTQPTKVLPQKG